MTKDHKDRNFGRNYVERATWDNTIEHYPPKTTWQDIVGIAIGSLIVFALLTAIVVIGH